MTKFNTDFLPDELKGLPDKAKRAIFPIKPVDDNTEADPKFLSIAQETDAGNKLPPYYLVYFLLVDLLGFSNIGRSEKIDWSIPLDFEGRAYLIEHRKFGIGVFAHNAESEETQAQQIVRLITKGVQESKPFFDWLAKTAVHESKFNVRNKSITLFDRYQYFRECFNDAISEANTRKDEKKTTIEQTKYGETTTATFIGPSLYQRTGWLGIAAIDAFFSWSEHVLIHIAILESRISTGEELATLAEAEWQIKFKSALNLSDSETKKYFDQLVIIRRQIRNFLAHGAFGKQGEAFDFHSGAGAVPVRLNRKSEENPFSLSNGNAFDESSALATIDEFIDYLWSGVREPAKIYIQETTLPLILPMVKDGTYKKAMCSVKDMNSLVSYLLNQFDNAANMDWF